ncbi:TetR/AcrR family transcriptional regulator [Microbacterium sp. CBA3102]|uniref:TetR/AcrR family transcriptional regulator n=1 Tax=Microbacterium sp. CBA3102 TaxID=2603598 RepID=UPI00224053DF|nr:TetR/AcrR family transcriptional regulator [Microbacterium sp. CBA3102]
MRSLAQELGVEAMSLYRYVHGREDLLEGVIALLLGQLTSNLDEEFAEHWQGFLQDVAHKMRQMGFPQGAVPSPRAGPTMKLQTKGATCLPETLRPSTRTAPGTTA